MNKFLESALFYRSLNWSVIPLTPMSKVPPKGFEVMPYRDRLATEEEIRSWWRQWPEANVAVITGKLSNLFVVDFDKYKPEYSEEKALEYFPDNIVTPIDRSARGGEHHYYLYPGEDFTIHADTLPAIDYRCDGGYVMVPPSSFNGSSATWIVKPDEVPLSVAPPQFLSLIKNNTYTRGVDKDILQMSTMSTNVYKEGRRDQDLFHIATLLLKAHCEDEYLYKTLEILALNCKPPFPLNEARAKIKSAIDRAKRKDRNLMQEIREDCLSTNGVFLSTEQAKRLQLSTREELKNQSICLRRLWKNEGIIERYGNRHGSWRTVDQEEELIDYRNVDLKPYGIRLPLDVHEYVTIHKGNIIVIAGESNAGKTAYLMNVALRNCNDFHVNYMSSEMQDGTELRVRMDKFDVPIDRWNPIKFQFRTDNFPDKIVSDGLNIVDYLDEGNEEEAHRMPSRLRNIADKLKTGIALVSIQKNPEKIYGYGGAGTLNRSRLYMTITRNNILTIVKGKMWRNEAVNPNGLFCQFTLAAGCHFKRDGIWKR